MAGDGDKHEEEDEEMAIERQLEEHLEEQKESLAALDSALVSDPSNPELLAVHGELLMAIKDAEEGLLHLKRSRLLLQVDSLLSSHEAEAIEKDVDVEVFNTEQVEPERLEAECFSVGSKCRFRHTDGRWYNGQVIGLEGAGLARISFLNPTSESMLMCKFFQQQRCRFGSNCRLSHGFDIPTSSLKQYIPTIWQQSFVGSSIWATSGSGIWRKAELKSWDDKLKMAHVTFHGDGSSSKLGIDALSISAYAELSDDDEDASSSSEGSESLEEEDEDMETESDQQGVGFLEAAKLQRGVQTQTVIFAKWEHHTRGIASKMMANMGYREGMGLGVSGQGIVDPINVKVLPPKQSLDHAIESKVTEEGKGNRDKKRSRGGKRKREKKNAMAAQAAKAREEPVADLFSFINEQLAGKDLTTSLGNKLRSGSDKAKGRNKMEDRRSLVAYDDEMKELRGQIEKLEEMVSRNRNKDKAMYEAASRKLNQTRKDLTDAEAAHASVSSAVVSKEKEKKWLKF